MLRISSPLFVIMELEWSISEEMSKKKGWHRRSKSCPPSAQPEETNPSTHSEPTYLDAELDMKDENSSGSSTPDPLLTDPVNESVNKNKMCELCAAKLCKSCWKRSEANEEVKHSIESNPLLQKDIVDSERDLLNQKTCTEKFREGASVQELKQCTDCLDFFGQRKEFFLKILHDPGSPLLHYLHNRQAFNSKMRLTKSVSFPLAGSLGRRVLESTNNEFKQGSAFDANGKENFQVCHRSHHSVDCKLNEAMIEQSVPPTVDSKEVGTSLPMFGIPRSLNNLPPCSPRGLKIEHENTPVKRFKNLRKKITRAIRENRKEKQKLAMDSVFPKIPYDRNSSKVIKAETDDLQKDVGTNKYIRRFILLFDHFFMFDL